MSLRERAHKEAAKFWDNWSFKDATDIEAAMLVFAEEEVKIETARCSDSIKAIVDEAIAAEGRRLAAIIENFEDGELADALLHDILSAMEAPTHETSRN